MEANIAEPFATDKVGSISSLIFEFGNSFSTIFLISGIFVIPPIKIISVINTFFSSRLQIFINSPIFFLNFSKIGLQISKKNILLFCLLSSIELSFMFFFPFIF